MDYITSHCLMFIEYNFLDCNWFKKLLFSTNLLAKLLSDSLLIVHFVIGQFVIGQFNNKPITFTVVVSINQSQPSFQSP